MSPANGEPDVLGKMDALLTRHKTGEPTLQDLVSAEAQATRASIPVLTEIVTDDNAIPVLTEAVSIIKPGAAAPVSNPMPLQAKSVAHEQIRKDMPNTSISRDEAVMRQIEELMVRELENRIALEFTATLDRAMNELLDHTREHIRLAVRVALKQRLDVPPQSTDQD